MNTLSVYMQVACLYNNMIELRSLVTRILHVEALLGTARSSLFLAFLGPFYAINCSSFILEY